MVVTIDTGHITFGQGEYMCMCSSSFNITEYFKLPYKTRFSKGDIFISDSGYITATSDEFDSRYSYGDDIVDEDEKRLIPLIETHVGMTYDEIKKNAIALQKVEYKKFVKSCAC